MASFLGVKKTMLLFMAVLICAWQVVGVTVSVVFADDLSLPESEIKAINNYPNWVGVCGSAIDSPSESKSAAKDESVYILGDSITARSESQYEQAFSTRGISGFIDASSSRSLVARGIDGNKLGGLAAIQHDKSKIKDASAVIIALGTNGGTNNQNIATAISQIKKINSSTEIYWVDTISVGRQDNYNRSVIGPANQAIYDQAKKLDYQVISWFKAVDPRGNPEKPSTTEDDPNNYIDPSDELGVHPTAVGSNALASLVTETITNALQKGEDVDQASCCSISGGGGTILNGKTNGIKAYNFYIKKGLTPAVAAGIVGNYTGESVGVEPQRLQGDFTGRHSSQSLTPAQLSDDRLGWGIAQFTPPQKIITTSRDKGTSFNTIDTLAFQLDFTWDQFQSNEKPAFDAFRNAKTPEEAAHLFFIKYERGAAWSEVRAAYARAYYNLATKGTPLPSNVPVSKTDGGGPDVSGGGQDSGQQGCTDSGAGIGGYKNPYRDLKQKQPLRIDMGVDYAGIGPIYAIGNGVVNVVYKRGTGSGWPGWGVDGAGGWVSYTLSDGPAAGKTVYFAENCQPVVKPGDKVTADTKICDLDGLTSAWSETGWAADKVSTSAAAHVEWRGHDSSAYYTAYGENFSQLLEKLGAAPGTKQAGAQRIGTLPAGWPKWD